MPEQHARATLYADGSAVVEAGTPEFGTGVGTMMTQVAADALGLPCEAVRYRLGDSDLPNITAAVGSAGPTMVSAAVHDAATALRDQLDRPRGRRRGVAAARRRPGRVEVADGRLVLRDSRDEATATPTCSAATA